MPGIFDGSTDRYRFDGTGPSSNKRSLDKTDPSLGAPGSAANQTEDAEPTANTTRPRKKQKKSRLTVSFNDTVSVKISHEHDVGPFSDPESKSTPKAKQTKPSQRKRPRTTGTVSPYFATPQEEPIRVLQNYESPLATKISKSPVEPPPADEIDGENSTPSSTFPAGTWSWTADEIGSLGINFNGLQLGSKDSGRDNVGKEADQLEAVDALVPAPQQDEEADNIELDGVGSTQNWDDPFLCTQTLRGGCTQKPAPAPKFRTASTEAQQVRTHQPDTRSPQNQAPDASFPGCTWSFTDIAARLEALVLENTSRFPITPSQLRARQVPSGSIASTFACSWSFINRVSQIAAASHIPPQRNNFIWDGNFYAVRIGRDPGIYKDPREALEQIDKLKLSHSAIFKDEEEAHEWVLHEDSKDCRWREWCCPLETTLAAPNDEQALVINAVVQCRQNVCLQGPGGTGKSFVLRKFVRLLEESGKAVYVIAPSALAALNVNGITCDSYAGWTPETKKKAMGRVMREALRGFKALRMRKTDCLVVDEISMVSSVYFDRLSGVCQGARGRPGEAFGGMQVVVIGDFRQLGPVKPFERCGACGVLNGDDLICPKCNMDWSEWHPLTFSAPAWEACNFTYLALTKPQRQHSDLEYFNILNSLRKGALSSQDIHRLLHHETSTEDGLHLLAKNDEVERRNEGNLNTLPGPSTLFDCLDHTEWTSPSPSADQQFDALELLRSHHFPRKLELRLNMPVMLSFNINFHLNLVNGTKATLIAFQAVSALKVSRAGDYLEYRQARIEEWDEKFGKEGLPVVRLEDGSEHVIHPVCLVQSIEELDEEDGGMPSLVSRTQIPLVPAWAVTMHKSQGQTLEKVTVHMDSAWDRKQAYTALSRATTLKGMKVVSSDGLMALKAGGRLTEVDKKVDEFFAEKYLGVDL